MHELSAPSQLARPPPAGFTYPYPITSSSSLSPSPLRPNLKSAAIRASYLLSRAPSCPPPLISASFFVPPTLTEHLLRKKRPTAIGSKFVKGSAITNMEGALHTFVTAFLPIELHGDYVYDFGHKMAPFALNSDSKSQMRRVVLSTMIHLDFETDEVALLLYSLSAGTLQGRPLGHTFAVLDTESKQVASMRHQYDLDIRSHLVYHLTAAHSLPPLSAIATPPNIVWTVIEAIQYISSFLERLGEPSQPFNLDSLANHFVRCSSGEILSLEMLHMSYVHSLSNEFRALDFLVKPTSNAYIYTYDPPSIFARYLDATLLNRLMVLGLRYLLCNVTTPNFLRPLRVFAFNSFADADAITLLRQVCLYSKNATHSYSHVQVLPRSTLFSGPGGTLNTSIDGVKGATLVIHNNSDGFGQNIEFEGDGGSLDGAIGCNSNAAVGLKRERKDLLQYVI